MAISKYASDLPPSCIDMTDMLVKVRKNRMLLQSNKTLPQPSNCSQTVWNATVIHVGVVHWDSFCGHW